MHGSELKLPVTPNVKALLTVEYLWFRGCDIYGERFTILVS